MRVVSGSAGLLWPEMWSVILFGALKLVLSAEKSFLWLYRLLS